MFLFGLFVDTWAVSDILFEFFFEHRNITNIFNEKNVDKFNIYFTHRKAKFIQYFYARACEADFTVSLSLMGEIFFCVSLRYI